MINDRRPLWFHGCRRCFILCTATAPSRPSILPHWTPLIMAMPRKRAAVRYKCEALSEVNLHHNAIRCIPLRPNMVGVIANLAIYLTLAAGVHYYTRQQFSAHKIVAGAAADRERFSCRPFLPKLFANTPPHPNHPIIAKAVKELDEFLANRFSAGDIDGLSVAVVSSIRPLYEKNWGVQRGNESATSPPMTSRSAHRIASVVKIFPVLEGIILEQRGVISW